MAIFLPAYIIDSSDWSRPGTTQRFLHAAAQLHLDMNLPCSLFVRGQVMEDHPGLFKRAAEKCGPLFDFQQCTYSGLPLKTVCQEEHDGMTVFHAPTLRQAKQDIARARDVMERVLGMRPSGLAGPMGYYRGLADRPELLAAARELGIQFTRTWTRNARDWFPLAFETQPFAYEAQGYSDILEIPGQGWPDAALREALKFDDVEAYLARVKKDVDYVAAKELTWSYAQQDWSALLPDDGMRLMRQILEYALQRGLQVTSHRQFTEDWRRQSGAA